MAGQFEECNFDFDLDFLSPGSNLSVTSDKFDAPDKTRKAILRVKKKILGTNSLISKYYDKRDKIVELDRLLRKSQEECRNICLEFRNISEKHDGITKELEIVRCTNAELEDKLNKSQNLFEANQSHMNQLQILAKENETTINSLTKENQHLKTSNKCDKNVETLQKANEDYLKDICVLRDIICGKKKLNKRNKLILKKYEKHVASDDDGAFDTEDDSDTEIETHCVLLPTKIENLEIESAIKTVSKSHDNEQDSDCSNELASRDTGRGSSLAFSDKCFNSPDYFLNHSPINTQNEKDKRSYVDTATSPIPFDEANDKLRGASPVTHIETIELVLSPINTEEVVEIPIESQHNGSRADNEPAPVITQLFTDKEPDHIQHVNFSPVVTIIESNINTKSTASQIIGHARSHSIFDISDSPKKSNHDSPLHSPVSFDHVEEYSANTQDKDLPQNSVINLDKTSPQKSAITLDKKSPQKFAITADKKSPQKSAIILNENSQQKSATTSKERSPQNTAFTSDKRTPQKSAIISDNKSPQRSAIILDDIIPQISAITSDRNSLQKSAITSGKNSPQKSADVITSDDSPRKSAITSDINLPLKEKEFLELNSRTHFDETNKGDCEIEMILNKMRFNRTLITPIPATPSKSRKASRDKGSKSSHRRERMCKEAAQVRKENKILSDKYDKLAQELVIIKNMLVSKSLGGIQLIGEPNVPKDFDNSNNTQGTDNNIITNTYVPPRQSELKNMQKTDPPLSTAVSREVVSTVSVSPILNNSPLRPSTPLLKEKEPQENDLLHIQHCKINDKIDHSENIERHESNTVDNHRSDKIMSTHVQHQNNIDGIEWHKPDYHEKTTEVDTNSLQIDNLENNSMIDDVVICVTPEESNSKRVRVEESVGEDNIINKRHGKLSKLEKLRKNLVPKGKIKSDTTTTFNKKRLKPKQLPVLKSTDSEHLNNKTAYEKAVQIMSELKSQQNVIKPKEGNICIRNERNENNEQRDTSASQQCKTITNECSPTKRKSVDFMNFKKELVVAVVKCDENRNCPFSMSPPKKQIATRSRSKSNNETDSPEQQNIPISNNQLQNVTTPKINTQDVTPIGTRKRQKSDSTDNQDVPCKRILRSSNSSQSTNDKEKKNDFTNSSSVLNHKSADNSVASVNASVIDKSMINYNDLDIFSDTHNISKNNSNLQNDSKISCNSKEVIFCTILDKYGKQTRKTHPKKVPDSIITSISKTLQDEINNIEMNSSNATVGMNKLVESIQSWDFKHFMTGLISYLKDPQRKVELFNKVSSPPGPSMTKSEQILLYVVSKLRVGSTSFDVLNCLLCNIEYVLFKLNRTPEFDTIESMAHFYAVLCRYFKMKTRLRLFMIDAMYCMQFKAVPLIRQCLDVWTHILPLAHMGIAKSPLVTCFVYLLHFYKCEDRLNRVQDIRNILKQKYFYEITEWNEPKIIEMFRSAIRDIRAIPVEMKLLRMALILISKRHGPKWCQNNIIKKLLLPMLEKESPERVKIFCISMLGPLLKPYPVDMKVHCEIVINLLSDKLKQNPSLHMQEVIISSLIYLSKHNQNHLIQTLLTWKPQRISPWMESMLRDVVREKPLHIWKTVLSKIRLPA